MVFIGDVHAKFSRYLSLVEQHEETFQVGDFGVGFGIDPPTVSLAHKFIRGNHDCREDCYQQMSYLGDYGFWKQDVFFVGGGFSIDRAHRTEGVNWWPNEELSESQMRVAENIYAAEKPNIVVSHCCPKIIQCLLFNFPRVYDNRTIQLFDRLWMIHKPKLWVFGHYHRSRDQVVDGCRFVCLDELEAKEINLEDYK